MKFMTLNPTLTDFEVKSDGEGSSGIVAGYASVFNNVDHGGEVVVRGAFRKTIKERIPSGEVYFMDSHRVWEGTAAVIGVVTEAKEDDHGLRFTARFTSDARAQTVRIKMLEGVLKALSFGYDVVKADGGDEVNGRRQPRYLRELKLYEISAVIWGMNPLASITDSKGIVSGAHTWSQLDEYPLEKYLADMEAKAATEPPVIVPDTQPEPELVVSEHLKALHANVMEAKTRLMNGRLQALRDSIYR